MTACRNLVLLTHMGIILIYVMSHVHPAGWPSCFAKNFSVGHFTQTVKLIFFHTCHAYMHHWLLLFYTTFTDLDLAWGSHGQHEANTVGFIFLHIFHLFRMKFDVVRNQFKLNILRLLLSKICWNKGNNCCFADCVKKHQQYWHAFRHWQISLIQTWYDDRYYWTVHCSISLIDLDLDKRLLECEKAKTSAPIIKQSFQLI